MRVSPLIAAPALLLLAVVAAGATLIAERRQPRKRAPAADEVEADAPAPRAPEPRRFIPPAPRARQEAAPSLHALRLRVAGPHGLRPRHIAVTLSPAGSDGGEEDAEEDSRDLEAADDGSYVVAEIEPGRYDVTVTADGLSRGRLERVASDAGTVEVALARAPVLVGTVGGGEAGCARISVAVTDNDGEEMEDAVEPADCSFMFEGLAPGIATVTARLPDREARTAVEIPSAGDPAPVCLEPPCRQAPPVLAVLVGDGDGFLVEEGTLSWELAVGEDTVAGGVQGLGGLNVVRSAQPGVQAHVVAAGAGEEEGDSPRAEATVTLAPGVNEIVLIAPGR